MNRILIIEDDKDLQEGLAFSFGMDGYEVSCTDTKTEGIKRIKKENYDLILLDCNLPDGSGFDLCREVRSFSQVPILMLTARDTEMDEVKALELGVDDYMSKPFSLAVLKARVKKIMRMHSMPQMVESDGIRIDKDACRIWRGTSEVLCSKIEYRLLCYLMENKNQVLTKEQILEHIWDRDGKFVDENTVSVNIRRLRAKIEQDPANPERIQTVYGLGYRWKEEDK